MPRDQQERGIDDEVVQIIEPAMRIIAGPTVQLTCPHQLAGSLLASRRRLADQRGTAQSHHQSSQKSAWDHRVKPRWDSVPIGDVRPSQVQEWVRDLVAEGVGPASSSRLWSSFEERSKSAVDDRAIATNPVANIKAPRRKHQRRGYLTHRQVNALIGEVDDAVSATVILFLAYTGLFSGGRPWGRVFAPGVCAAQRLMDRV
jgi:integrase